MSASLKASSKRARPLDLPAGLQDWPGPHFAVSLPETPGLNFVSRFIMLDSFTGCAVWFANGRQPVGTGSPRRVRSGCPYRTEALLESAGFSHASGFIGSTRSEENKSELQSP